MREANDRWAAYVTRLVRAKFAGNNSLLASSIDVSPSTVTRWIDGATPTIAGLRAVHSALDIPMMELLAAAGALDGDEQGEQPAREIDTVSVIAEDPDLVEEARAHLLSQYDILRRFSSGMSGSKGAERPLRAVARKRPSRGPQHQ